MTVITLFLKIPVTVTIAELSFSDLKFIKNYFRSQVRLERFCGLTIKSFAEMEGREVEL
jgi:hypothetical protein